MRKLKNSLTDEELVKIRMLRAQDLSVHEIARRIGRSHGTVHTHLKRFKNYKRKERSTKRPTGLQPIHINSALSANLLTAAKMPTSVGLGMGMGPVHRLSLVPRGSELNKVLNINQGPKQESTENHEEFKMPKITNAERQRMYRQRLKDRRILLSCGRGSDTAPADFFKMNTKDPRGPAYSIEPPFQSIREPEVNIYAEEEKMSPRPDSSLLEEQSFTLDSVQENGEDTYHEPEARHKKSKKISGKKKLKKSSTIQATLDSLKTVTKAISAQHDEFSLFGEYMAMSLRTMPMRNALKCKEKLLSVIVNERLSLNPETS